MLGDSILFCFFLLSQLGCRGPNFFFFSHCQILSSNCGQVKMTGIIVIMLHGTFQFFFFGFGSVVHLGVFWGRFLCYRCNNDDLNHATRNWMSITGGLFLSAVVCKHSSSSSSDLGSTVSRVDDVLTVSFSFPFIHSFPMVYMNPAPLSSLAFIQTLRPQSSQTLFLIAFLSTHEPVFSDVEASKLQVWWWKNDLKFRQ